MIQYFFMSNVQTHPLHATDKNIIDSLITKEKPEDLDFIKNLFNFFFGANFTQSIAKFLGLFSLLIYTLGLIQWSIIKLPKYGRNSCFSENGKN